MKYKYIYIGIAILGLLLFYAIDLQAQCPMCRMSAESNLAAGGSEGRGLNKGILYMLSLPYILIGTIGYLWWKNNRDNSENA